jgi:hypothetical protein
VIIDKKDYKGFQTKFRLLPAVQDYLKTKKIETSHLTKSDPSHWYEHTLFELLDKNRDGKPDKEFGKIFEVVFYGVIEKWIDMKPEGFEKSFRHDRQRVIDDSFMVVNSRSKRYLSPFGIRYKIIKKS